MNNWISSCDSRIIRKYYKKLNRHTMSSRGSNSAKYLFQTRYNIIASDILFNTSTKLTIIHILTISSKNQKKFVPQYLVFFWLRIEQKPRATRANKWIRNWKKSCKSSQTHPIQCVQTEFVFRAIDCFFNWWTSWTARHRRSTSSQTWGQAWVENGFHQWCVSFEELLKVIATNAK